jgi:hypothetical protein
MVSSEKHPREALEKLFAKPFTDYQWSLISAQGFEDAILSGTRTAEEVARELKDLVEAAARRTSRSAADALHQTEEEPVTWDQMEKLVLGRILTTGETSGPKPTLDSPDGGVRLRRLSVDRRRSRKRLWVVLAFCGAALFVAAAALLLFFGPVWGLWGTSPLVTVATVRTVTNSGYEVEVSSTTSSTIMPPATIPALEAPDYEAHLTGADMVPAVDTEATGSLSLRLSEDGQSMEYVLAVQSFTGLTVARLRTVTAEDKDEEIVSLYLGPTKKGLFSGVVADWAFGADAFMGPLEGKTMTDFIALVESGSVYVNVSSSRHRDGEIRGQLK